MSAYKMINTVDGDDIIICSSAEAFETLNGMMSQASNYQYEAGNCYAGVPINNPFPLVEIYSVANAFSSCNEVVSLYVSESKFFDIGMYAIGTQLAEMSLGKHSEIKKAVHLLQSIQDMKTDDEKENCLEIAMAHLYQFGKQIGYPVSFTEKNGLTPHVLDNILAVE